MLLRKQNKTGGRHASWTLEEIDAGLKEYFKEHGNYPTAHEVDDYEYLPSARSIERSFGGLVNVRKKLKLGTESDFRTGAHSTKRAHTINQRAHKMEQKVYEFLVKRFGIEFVHREYFFTDDHRTRADFFVYDSGKGFCVDVFYPNSRRNMLGCINLKLSKYAGIEHAAYPVIYLQMNEDISEETIARTMANKKRPLPKGQRVMGWQTFQEFCNSRGALKVTIR
ncbi:MAG: hypothetical protein A3D65_06280 [Candidatus Lloydbacteria bacterium RIFCSPHIGHO2_02_FULL_50_13]|uniref:Uncharacterized protein n=1 Tax=Candidatus Lloydbacteria bacterium RIFCSPHIGHO2_02_FULL_50_13 TaxID=1798661 RepID=A0A1G2D366_9BACT|nr:MAG: hypothetical protein A3D65_06280 [Candidatus Lloydbacteria bacterium RIFCSPHIGHO2_02_FULL_50_13]